MTKPIFYEGQQVGCLLHGEGVVGEVLLTHESNIIKCVFKYIHLYYTIDGRYATTTRPTLYPIEQYRAIVANLPAPQPEKWQPKPGEWCWFWENHNSKVAVIAKFVEILNKKYRAEICGQLVYYTNCAPFTGELPEHLKEALK